VFLLMPSGSEMNRYGPPPPPTIWGLCFCI
jgi:hypothetical protein